MKIYRAADPEPIEVADVSIDKTTIFTQQLMGEHKVDANWISPAPLNLNLGDYILEGTEKLYLNRPASIDKSANFLYKYSCQFEGEIYTAHYKILLDEKRKRFSYFGGPEEILLLILDNLNEKTPGWTLNLDLPTEYEPQNLEFDGDSCRVALTKVMEAFKLEFRPVQREIIVREDVGFESTYSFSVGRHAGLYNLSRLATNDKPVVTRLYGYGGTQNIPSGYRDGVGELIFEVGGNHYVESNKELYGLREDTVTFPDIYPKRTGSVTAVNANNKVVDSTLDFDINAHLLGGVTVKIVFKSGALSGYEFEIDKNGGYNHATKEITFIPTDEVGGAVIPDEGSFQPEIGDTYTLVGIDMPASYVTAAETELYEATQAAHAKIDSPRGIYGLGIDEKHVRTNGIALACGMRVGVVDAPLGLDDTIRIYAISYPKVNPSEISAQIADTIPLTTEERQVKDIQKGKRDIVEVDRSRIESIRESMQYITKMKDRIFDSDGYFDLENLRPASLETLFFSAGARSRNYSLNGVEIETNYEGDPNSLRISGGNLVHWSIAIEGLGYIWEMDQNIFEDLNPAEDYYIYARCNKSALTGIWVASVPPIMTEQEAGFYHFGLGTLFAVADGKRYFHFEKGMTFIIGDMIKTGTIQSYDGLNFFNLTSGKFNLGDETSGLDWDVTNPGALTIRGAVIASAILADDGVIANLKVKSLKTAESGKRMEILAFQDEGETVPAHYQKFYNTDGSLAITIDSEIDGDFSAGSAKAGMRVQNSDNSRIAMITANGVFSNASGVDYLPLSTGRDTNASMAAVLFERNDDLNGISAAVAGIDATTAGNSRSFGGHFNSALIEALYLNSKQILTSAVNYSVTDSDVFISSYNSNTCRIYLPANPKKDRFLLIRRNNAGVIIDGNGNDIIVEGVVSEKGMGANRGDLALMFFDGSYWTFNRMKL